MKFSAAAVCISAFLAPVAAASIFTGRAPAVSVNDDQKIPGESPLELCPGDHAADLIKIEEVNLLPNPPQAGKQLVIEAKGTVKQTIEEGAYVLLTVKYGLIRLISTKADLCEQIGNVDLKCPVEAGHLTITKDVDLPAEIPPGQYTVLADVFTKEDVQITCLTATVSFGTQSGFFGGDL